MVSGASGNAPLAVLHSRLGEEMLGEYRRSTGTSYERLTSENLDVKVTGPVGSWVVRPPNAAGGAIYIPLMRDIARAANPALTSGRPATRETLAASGSC
jgi:hypothetical protein